MAMQVLIITVSRWQEAMYILVVYTVVTPFYATIQVSGVCSYVLL